VAGRPGENCVVFEVLPSEAYPQGGAVVTCGPTSVVVKNGADGEMGAAGSDAVVQLIDPCGDAPGVLDEVILRLSSGVLLASVSDNTSGKNTRFAVITPGSYATTDGTGCTFTVDADGAVN
jgi:hypothetical protein